MAAVFDADAIRARRRELFGGPSEPPPIGARLFGNGMLHCEICPIDKDAYCSLSCSEARERLAELDGVKVY